MKPPEPTSEAVSRSMRSNKCKDTKPEIVVRGMLRDMGYPGYRLQWKKAPGRPDICYPGKKIAIFVNGCFWHRCPVCDLPMPKSHLEYWNNKFESNVDRDRRKRSELESLGWDVVVIWECEIKKSPDLVREKILNALSEKD